MRLVLAAAAEAAPIYKASWVLLSSMKERRQEQTTCCRVAHYRQALGKEQRTLCIANSIDLFMQIADA